MAQSSCDPWASPAIDLLNAWHDRGIAAAVQGGRLVLTPADRLTDEDVAQAQTHRRPLLLLALTCDPRTLDRLVARRTGRLRRGAAGLRRGRCHTCGEALPASKRFGACGWCRLAEVQLAGSIARVCSSAGDVLSWFDEDVSGATSLLLKRGA